MARGCIRREVNLINEAWGPSVGTAQYPGATIPLVTIDSDDYSGTKTAYLECIAKNSNVSARNVGTIRDNTNPHGAGNELIKTVSIPGNTTSWTRFRSTSFSLHTTQIYYNLYVSDADVTILAARIVIIQSGADTTDIYKTIGQFEVGAREQIITTGTTTEPLTNPKFVYFDPNNYDQVLDGYASVVVEGPSTKGTSGGSIVKLQRTTDFVTWVDGPTIVSGAIGAVDPPYVFYDTTFPSTALTAPGSSTHPTWWRLALVPTAKDGFGIVEAKIGVRQDGGSTSSGITKTEDQYLMINNPPGTGPSEFYIYFDPSTDEWESIANEYYYQMDSEAAPGSTANTFLIIQGSTIIFADSQIISTLQYANAVQTSTLTLGSSVETLDCFVVYTGA